MGQDSLQPQKSNKVLDRCPPPPNLVTMREYRRPSLIFMFFPKAMTKLSKNGTIGRTAFARDCDNPWNAARDGYGLWQHLKRQRNSIKLGPQMPRGSMLQKLTASRTEC